MLCILTNLFLFLLFLLLILFPIRSTAKSCHTETCSSSFYIPIRFPFWIEGVHPQGCGCPGFNLNCNSLGKTVLKLPNSVEFFVRDIDYQSNKIELYEDCLPRKLRGLDLSRSPFSSSYHVNYTFLSCRWNIHYLLPVPCLSNNNSTDYTLVMAANSSTRTETLLSHGICDAMFALVMPTALPAGSFMLSWSTDSFKCNASEEIWDHNTHTGHSKKKRIIEMVFMSVGLLIISAVTATCYVLQSGRRNGGINPNNNLRQGITIGNSTDAAVTNGLDGSTIASFTQEMILGESRHSPGLNDNMCPICLSEYQPEEILRCIPDCKHCFHAKCIDEWFKKNVTCPVCRNRLIPCPS